MAEELQPKEIVCRDCKATFTLEVKEQQWYIDQKYHEPRRCLPCREKRRAERAHQA